MNKIEEIKRRINRVIDIEVGITERTIWKSWKLSGTRRERVCRSPNS